MSSNLRIVKICRVLQTGIYCQEDIPRRRVLTACAKRLYKIKKRNEAISRAEVETMVKRRPEAFVTEEQVKAIQAKEWLTLVEAALLLNVSTLTLRRWTLAGKVKVARRWGGSICLRNSG